MRIQNRNTIAALGILGKVKIGDKATNANGKEHPVSLDYFRFTSNEAMRVERMREMFGEQPTKMPITFHCDDPNQICIQRYEIRDSAGKLIAYGDGVNFWESLKEGFIQKPIMTVQQGEAYMAEMASRNRSEWHETLTLRFMVLQYPELGLWEFSTKGKDTSIGQIIAAFDTVLESAGRVKGVPFWLTVSKHKSSRANANRQYPVANLVCDLSPEMVETVRALGDGVRGLITPAKLQSPLALAAPAFEQNSDIETIEFEESGDVQPPTEQPAKETFIVTVSEKVELPAEETKPEPPTEPEKKLVEAGTEDWTKAVRYIVLPGEKGGIGTIEALETKVRFNDTDREKLKDYVYYRDELTAGNMSMNMITAQNVNSADLEVFEQLDKVRRAQKVAA